MLKIGCSSTVRSFHPISPRLLYPASIQTDSDTISLFVLNSIGQEGLEKSCSIHSVLIYCLRSLAKLESVLSLPSSSHTLPHHPNHPINTEDLIEKLLASGRQAFWDQEKATYISGVDRQVSWASSVSPSHPFPSNLLNVLSYRS